MLRTRSLSFAYDAQQEFRFPDMQLDAGEKLLILGDSGIGKTTLLHLIAGLLRPRSGSVELQGTVLQDLSVQELDRFRGRHIGLVFQRPHFVQALSARENLELVQYLAGRPRDRQRIEAVAESLGIGNKLRERPHTISQGEQQRVAIALAVINHPQLILADEPTASLDDKNCEKVAALLEDQAAATGAQLIIITHDQRLKERFTNTLTL
ncbi:MAG: ATP-binding cassette domain-containing protein [Flavobacteriales bacterium]|nr:ATP-binding cassette domain-containing protein [Flavobacteriales bacterium]